MSSSKQNSSLTAACVLLGLSNLSEHPRWAHYFPKDMAFFAAQFTKHSRKSFVVWLLALLPPSFFTFLLDGIAPGMMHHYLFRKILIEIQVKQALKSGVKQIVVLGGGMDSLALRIASQYPEILFFEIDLPQTQFAKLEMLNKIAYPIPANCRFNSIDLTKESLPDLLINQAGFQQDLATLIIIEGVLMYLTENEVKALFSTLHSLISGPLSVLFGVLSIPVQQFGWTAKITAKFLGKIQEPLYWSCPSQAIPEFMSVLGYELIEWMPYKVLQSLYRSAQEISHLPDEDENYYMAVKKYQKSPSRSIDQIMLMRSN